MAFWILTLLVFGNLQDGIRSNPLSVADSGYVSSPRIGCHKIHRRATTWDRARSVCKEEGGDLAVINSKTESNVIRQLFISSLPHIGSYHQDYALVGFDDRSVEGQYVTIESETLVEAGFNEWAAKEPTKGRSENCGSIWKDGLLNDISCGQRSAFVCERPQYDQSICGKIVRVNVTVVNEIIAEGGEVSMACDVAGYPAPKVLWYKNDDLIRTNDRIKISGVNGLIISKANKNDAGKYRCKAANKYISDAHTVAIKVTGPSLPHDMEGYESTPGIGCHKIHSQAKTWDMAQSVCKDEGGNLAIVNSKPESKVISKLFAASHPHRDSEDQNYALIGFNDRSVQGQYVTIESETLVKAGFNEWAANEPNNSGGKEDCGSIGTDGRLNDLPCDRRYAFVCERPQYEQSICGKFVKVKVAVAKELIIEKGEISIDCDVTGYPTPRVLWFKNDNLVQTNDRIKISGANGLIIPRANKDDTGKYRCTAANKYMSDSHTVDIKVIGPSLPHDMEGYKSTPGIGCHKIHRQATTWDRARSVCKEEGGDLAVINSKTESEVLRQLFSSSLPHSGSQYRDYALIGFDDRSVEGQYVTIESETLVEAGFSEWAATEPNNTGGIENCGSIFMNGLLNDLSCDRRAAFVCERPQYDQSICGKIVRVNVTVVNEIIVEGGDVSMACDVAGYPAPKVLWYKNDDLIRTNDRIKISGVNGLIISKANKNDAGKYRCKAANKYMSNAHNVDIKVTVPVKVKIAMNSGLFPTESEINIACNADGYPTPKIQWYKNDNLIQKNERINIVANKLIISTAEKNDAGKYRCEAANEYTSSAETVDIKVAMPVKVKIAMNPGLFRTGSEISIACNADGYPTPKIQWYKNDNLIQNNERMNIVANKLIISTAEKNDVGKYRCEATNEYTSSAETVDVRVVVPVKVEIAMNPGPFPTGSEISIACNADGYPTPTIQWYKNDNRIQKNERINVVANKLIISTAEKNDAGKYRCEAANEYTSSAETVDIKVAMPVKVKIAMNPGLFRTGSEIRIACNADGYPTPKIQWYKNDNLIQNNERMNIVANKLIISIAEKNDAGKYRCEAANEYTSSAETVDVRVVVPVKVEIAMNPRPFPPGSEISIACNADGYPTPTIQWYKNDNRIQKNERINVVANKLIISNAEKNDAGKYRCEVANEYTSSAETVDIKVAMPVKVKIAMNPGLFRAGSEISIACNADGYPTPKIQWYKYDNLIQNNERMNIVANKLIISTAEKNDAGEYRCEAANEYTSSAETVDIRVAETSNSVLNAAGGYEYTAGIGYHKIHSLAKTSDIARSICQEEGGNLAVIESDQESQAIVKLFTLSLPHIGSNDSNYVLIGFHNHIVDLQYPSIQIENSEQALSDEQGLNESSIAESDFGNCESIDKNGRLNSISCNQPYAFTCERPEYKKEICEKAVGMNVTVTKELTVEGAEVSIACYVVGYPASRVRWYKDDNLIQTNDRINISGANKLIIPSANKNDTGKYRCEAANEYMIGAHTVDIIVIVPVKVKIAVNKGSFPERSEISIVCNTDGYPTPTVQWYKDDNLIEKTERIDIVANKMIISTAEKNDAGKYRCEAANEYTSSAETVDIKVAFPPTANITIEEGPFSPGSEISIACNVDGYPTPMVFWYKDANSIQTDNRITISPSNTLIIFNATRDDTGTYRCVAVNEMSRYEDTVDIKVAGIYIHPNCQNNSIFVRCNLIVKGNFCKHQWYSKFCCRACTEAGQLPAQGSNIDETIEESEDQSFQLSFS